MVGKHFYLKSIELRVWKPRIHPNPLSPSPQTLSVTSSSPSSFLPSVQSFLMSPTHTCSLLASISSYLDFGCLLTGLPVPILPACTLPQVTSAVLLMGSIRNKTLTWKLFGFHCSENEVRASYVAIPGTHDLAFVRFCFFNPTLKPLTLTLCRKQLVFPASTRMFKSLYFCSVCFDYPPQPHFPYKQLFSRLSSMLTLWLSLFHPRETNFFLLQLSSISSRDFWT